MAPSERLFMVDASSPMVAEITEDSALMRLWGYLRLATRPMTAPEICAAARLDAATVQAKLDKLRNHGLVEALPATTRRPGISFRALYAGLKIRCNGDADRGVMQRVNAAIRSHTKDLVRSDPRPEWLMATLPEFVGTLHLTPAELEELQRRLESIVEFTELVSAKYAKRGTDPELCNYVLNFRIDPLPEPALPLAPVRVDNGSTRPAEREPASERPAKGRLSARERQTAMALARGLTIEEVAKEMGLAKSTVSTMTKRIYRKLAVRRRAEMVTRLKELGL